MRSLPASRRSFEEVWINFVPVGCFNVSCAAATGECVTASRCSVSHDPDQTSDNVSAGYSIMFNCVFEPRAADERAFYHQ